LANGFELVKIGARTHSKVLPANEMSKLEVFIPQSNFEGNSTSWHNFIFFVVKADRSEALFCTGTSSTHLR
jgi:hypothetical protein